MSTPAREPLPPESWPGAGGRRSVAPAVPRWPGRPIETSREPGASWPGATTATDGPVAGWPGAAPTSTAGTTPAGPGGPGGGLTEDVDAELREPAHRVSPRAKPMWMVTSILAGLVPLAGLGVWMWFDDGRRAIQVPLLVIVLVLVIVDVVASPIWRYRVHRWEVTDAAVYTQSGWWSQERRLAPISRIQTVDAQFGPVERLFGLGTLVVTTASAAGPLHISGLERATVERLVADLTRVTQASPDDAT